MAKGWIERIPVVTVVSGIGDNPDEEFRGYGAQSDDGGSLCIFELEQGLDADQVRRKQFGRVEIFPAGTWERARIEWHPVVGELKEVV